MDYSNSFAYDYYILLVWPAGYVLDTTEGNILVLATASMTLSAEVVPSTPRKSAT